MTLHYHVMREGELGPSGRLGGLVFSELLDAITEFYTPAAHLHTHQGESRVLAVLNEGKVAILRDGPDWGGEPLIYLAACRLPCDDIPKAIAARYFPAAEQKSYTCSGCGEPIRRYLRRGARNEVVHHYRHVGTGAVNCKGDPDSRAWPAR